MFYFCSHCKNVLEKLDDLYFVEENFPRGFCSEDCIESFFAPIVQYLTDRDKKWREELGIGSEDGLLDNLPTLDLVVENPDKVFVNVNELGEQIHYLIKNQAEGSEQYFSYALCFIYQGGPSFVFLVSATRSSELIEKYSSGELTNLELHSETTEDSALPQKLELIKSEILADLINIRPEADIKMEDYTLYQKFMNTALEGPDEIYTQNHSDELIYTYIKALDQEGISFYYFVFCLKIDQTIDDSGEQQETLIPVISFPTVSPDVYHFFKRGEAIQKLDLS